MIPTLWLPISTTLWLVARSWAFWEGSISIGQRLLASSIQNRGQSLGGGWCLLDSILPSSHNSLLGIWACLAAITPIRRNSKSIIFCQLLGLPFLALGI